jgi:hypothetical protein
MIGASVVSSDGAASQGSGMPPVGCCSGDGQRGALS